MLNPLIPVDSLKLIYIDGPAWHLIVFREEGHEGAPFIAGMSSNLGIG